MWGSNPSPFREKLRVMSSLPVVDCCIRDEVYAAMWKTSWVAWFVDRRRLKVFLGLESGNQHTMAYCLVLYDFELRMVGKKRHKDSDHKA